MFRRCRTCVLTSYSAEFRHTDDEERALTGTWVMDKVGLAVENAYRIIEINMVYKYQVTQCNAETGEGVLFVDYINTFLKLKEEASDYPGWVHSPEDEKRYVETLWTSEGIRIEKESIRYNAAERGLATLCLNSMRGKLTESNNRTMTKVIMEPKELYGFLATPGIDVMKLVFANHDVVWIFWKYGSEKHVPSLRHSKKVIGAYVTAGARIDLYRYLDRLQENAIYCDTESVLYIHPRDEPALNETGDKLGDMASELHPSETILEFVSGKPKNFAYRVLDTVNERSKTVCIITGVTLNYNASQLVNFEVIRDMILWTGETTVNIHTARKIKRKWKGGGTVSIVTEPEGKL